MVAFIDDFKQDEAYKTMRAVEKARLAKSVNQMKNMLVSPEDAIKKMKNEFPQHQALAGLIEEVVIDIYARGF